jgi:hypothetical protein
MRETRNVYKILVGELEGKRSLGRPRRRWEKTIKMALKEIWWESLHWIRQASVAGSWKHGNEFFGFHKRLRI